MKQRIPQRLLSALLALVLLISSCPVAYGAELETVPETTAAVVETEAPETETVAVATESMETAEPTELPETTETVTEPVQETETVQTEPSAETEPAQETEPSAETEPSEETAPNEETIPEETEEAEQTCGLAGLPEHYVLSEEDALLKQDMIEGLELQKIAEMTAGEDYVADQVIVMAESEDEAAMMAAAFSGELIAWCYGTAKIRLLNASVVEAVEASLDPENNLPAAVPNYIAGIIPVEIEGDAQVATMPLPEQRDWEYWVREALQNPDPALLDPEASYFQWMHDTVGSYAAWGVTTGDSWVKVAVIDTGVNTTHTDLSGRVTTVDIGYGTTCADSHGTHVAGIIAGALDNGSGGAGIAPGVSIISIRACNDDGRFPFWDVSNAIYEAVAAGAQIINMSLSGAGYTYYLQDAISYAVDCGVTVIAAMGNAGTNAVAYPAAHDGVIAVAATDSANNRAFFSNYGSYADIAAPGEGIYSSVIGGYENYDGTSMAAPVVAGVAALYMSAVGEHVDPATMEKVLESNAVKIKDSGCGAGIVNIANMLDGVPEAPYCVITDGERYYSAKDPIPCDAWIEAYENEEAYLLGRSCDENGAFLWTFDGKAPSVKNGAVVHGTVLPENVGVLSTMPDQTHSIKVAYVSGMGVMGKVLSLNLKTVRLDEISSVTVHGSSKLIPGKSCTYTATVEPTDTADQTVTWKIYASNVSGAKIDAKTGKLTTPSGKTGTIYIRATSTADSSVKSSLFAVSVQNITPVSKITLDTTAVSAFVGGSGTIRVSKMVDTKGYTVSPSTSGVSWTSSNPKVVTVDANGNFTAVGKGTANITCMSLDGSGKKAQCKVTVLVPVESIEITGQGSIPSGTSATYKAVISPTSASNKKVTWSLSYAASGVSIDSKSGKVTVAKWVPAETIFCIRATAADKSGETAEKWVYVRNKCTAMSMRGSYSGFAAGIQTDNKGNVKTVNLFSLDLKESSGIDNSAQLYCYAVSDSDYMAYAWTSNAPHIAEVDDSGTVTAHKAGTATITLMAQDGSGKKATCTVKVTNPASTISISSSAPRMTTSEYYLAFGKSVKNTAVFANTYGKPDNQKVNWSYRVYQLDSDGSLAYNRTSVFSNNKLITLSSSGSLSVKAGAQKYWATYNKRLIVRVYATATDGTGASDYIDYNLIPQTTVLKPQGKNWYDYAQNGGAYIYFYSDQWYGFDASFTATSSNPKVVSIAENSIVYDGYDSSVGLNRYRVSFVYSGYLGTTNITIKAADGSNKSCSFSLRIY